jgi:regulator of chromosome condensation (RCC1) repeat-containing protein
MTILPRAGSHNRPAPLPVSGFGREFRFLSTADLHQPSPEESFTAAGTAYCWGRNDLGFLGDGTTIARRAPTAVTGGLVFASLTASGYAMCGVAVDGTAYCWGSNGNAQLGDGTTSFKTVPTAVLGGLAFRWWCRGRSTPVGLPPPVPPTPPPWLPVAGDRPPCHPRQSGQDHQNLRPHLASKFGLGD